ncbi:MAG: hypothetical protein KF813_11555 [Trueperaceae bacterium]|nr:hypothetical protein [Trueperaceae bacterium]
MSDSQSPGQARVFSFETPDSGWGLRNGLRGGIVFELREEGLFCVGKKAGHLLIQASKVEKLRSIVESSRYGSFYTTRIWVQNGPQPATIVVQRAESKNYIETIAHFAHRVATLKGLERLERGANVAGVATMLVLVLPVLLGALYVSIVALASSPWYQRFAPTFVILGLYAVLVWAARIMWPRPIKDWDEYLAVLQGLKGQRA